MIEKISKKFTQFYQFSLIFIMVVTLGTILYFWKLGFIDGSRSKELHKSSYILETYDSKNLFKEVNGFVLNENPKAAIQKIKVIQTDLEKVDKIVEVKEFSVLKDDFQKLKTASANLISFSKTTKVLKVFNEKMNKFYEFVKTNNWRTLTRMSDRVFTQTTGYVNKNKLSTLVRSVNRDFQTMVKITENSILSRKDKSEIVSRISNLQVEMEMLNKYIEERKIFSTLYKEADQNLKKWIEAVAPEVTFQKLKVEQIGRYYVMGLLGILFLVSTLFFTSFLFNKWFFKNAQAEIEKKIENYISKGLLESDETELEDFTTHFQTFSQRMSSYIDKRMSFGSIFQEALPLSSIMLDKNLKVVWANKQFCEDWKLSEEEINKDYMSWDFLNKLTNIGHDDPVLEALKHNIAGIYQVQIKAREDADVRPFEMFVSPSKHNGETRIMLFFYDLTNLEQTIQEQAKSILSPVKTSLGLLTEGRYHPTEELAHEFNIAQIDDVFEQFNSLDQSYKNKEEALLDQVEMLHSRIESLETMSSQLSQVSKESMDSNKGNIEALKIFKTNVIGLSGLTRRLNSITIREQELLYANINALKTSVNKIGGLKQATEELVNVMPRFQNIKEEIRIYKSNLYESKAKMSHELSQLNLLLKRAHEPSALEKLTRTLKKINNSFDQVNTNADELDKRISNLELVMSKANMILSSNQEKLAGINSDYEMQQVQISEESVKTIKKQTASSGDEIETFEHEIVGSLQSIFQGTKRNVGLSGEMNELLRSAVKVESEALNEQTQASEASGFNA